MSLRPAKFLGLWHIERNIEDSLSGNTSYFTGQAEILEQGKDWLYAERGQLKMQGAPSMTAERRYIWRANAGGIDVYFEDRRFFHRISLADAASAAHWCDPDQYDVRYDFSDWPFWNSVWSVSGPKKNYSMRSSYSAISI